MRRSFVRLAGQRQSLIRLAPAVRRPSSPTIEQSPVTQTSLDVLAIGNAIVDVIARTDDEFLKAERLIKGTMRLIDAEEAHRLYERMPAGVETSGGSAANTVAGLAALGLRTGFVGQGAKDQLGEGFG